ncbi:MAG: efflux RND transporter permease subunit [Vulcanimicrobiaceae bacterium]
MGNAKVIVFVVAVLALIGVRAYFVTPQSIFPTMSFSRIDVVADVGDLPPEQVRVGVTRPLEQALQSLPSVTDVVATSSQGTAELFVNFAASTDPHADQQLVDQAISQTRASIPSARNVVAVIVNPNSEPVLSFALTSKDLSQAVLRETALSHIVPKLYGTPGLGNLTVTGGPTTEFHVTLDPAKLAAQGISAADVSKTLVDANAVAAVGVSQHYYQRYAVLVDSSLHDRASLERVTVPTKNGASVPISSLGTVTLGVSPIVAQTSLDGTHAVIINAYGLAGADTVKMAAAFEARLAGVTSQLPRDIGVKKFWDQTTLIVESQKALRDAIVMGAMLAIVVIYAFLRDVRLTLVAATVIPLAMAIAVFALGLAGQTLNLMSVGGLAVAVGLIIDDAIVVIENIARNGRTSTTGSESGDRIERSLAQLAAPMFASTATTVVVFLPLALLSGVTGFFFRALAFTLSVSLVVSLLLALFVAPTIASILLRHGGGDERKPDAIGAVLDRYDRVLRWALGHRPIVAALSCAVLVVTVVLLARLPSDFLPKMDEGQFEIAYTMPVGTTLEASDAASSTMERVIAADPAVAGVGRLTGIDSNGFTPTQSNQGLLRVRLVPPTGRASYDDVSARLRDRLTAVVPASKYDFHQILEDLINGLTGMPAPIEISIKGPDQKTLIDLARRATDAISSVPGVVDANSGVVYNSPSLRIAPRSAVLSALGLTSSDVGDAVAALGQGTIATSLPGSTALVPVRVRVAAQDGGNAGLLQSSTSLFAKGTATAVGDIATITPMRLSSDIVTENGQTLVRLTANITGRSLSAVTAGITEKLRGVRFPPGYSFEIGGQAQSQKRSFGEFLGVIAIAIALVFAVMLATFRSYRLPLVILTAIPLALIGVALGLFLTGTPFNVSSFMGLLLLVGVVVKNGILLIDVANRERADGATVDEALLEAGKTRLRPIVMTTLAAIGGLIPLAIGIGQGAEMEKPLAIAVIGGLSTATIFTLVVIPVLYATFAGRSRPPLRAAAIAARRAPGGALG